MPIKGWHAARIKDPDLFVKESFRTKTITEGINLIIGKLKSDPEGDMVSESYRFDAQKFTAQEAKAWLKDHDVSYISFEEGKKEEKAKSGDNVFYRFIPLEIRREKDSLQKVSAILSTEEPIDRGRYIEILDHGPNSVDLSRASHGLSLLFSHNPEIVVGKAEEIFLHDRKLRGSLTPARNPKAQEVWTDISDGCIRGLSIGYAVDWDSKEVIDNTYRFKKWSLLECSVVAVPADQNCQIGRSYFYEKNIRSKGDKMNKCPKCSTELLDGKCPSCQRSETEKERIRVSDIMSTGQKMGLLDKAMEFVREGKPFSEFSALVIADARAKLDLTDIRVSDSPQRYTSANGPIKVRGPFFGQKYEVIFGQRADMGKWKNVDEFFHVLTNRLGDSRLERTHSEGVGTAGGFLLPDLVSAMFWDNAMEESVVMGKAAIYPMVSDSLKVPGMSLGDHSENLYGGIAGGWTSEGLEAEEQNAKLRVIGLQAQKLFLYTKASNELLSDTPMDTAIRTCFTKAADFFIDDKFISGNGIGAPLGVLTAGNAALLTVSRATANTVKFADLTGMLALLNPNSFKNAVWLCHPTCLDPMNRLIIYDGATAIAHYPILGAGGAMQLFGRPVVISEKCGRLGSSYDVALVDFSQYIIGLRSETGIQISSDEHFRKDLTSFRLISRIDGCPAWDHFLVLKDAVSKVSPYVALV